MSETGYDVQRYDGAMTRTVGTYATVEEAKAAHPPPEASDPRGRYWHTRIGPAGNPWRAWHEFLWEQEGYGDWRDRTAHDTKIANERARVNAHKAAVTAAGGDIGARSTPNGEFVDMGDGEGLVVDWVRRTHTACYRDGDEMWAALAATVKGDR